MEQIKTRAAKYPHIEVALADQDSNVFYILGMVSRALKEAVGQDEASAYYREATSENTYAHVLDTTLRWVTVV